MHIFLYQAKSMDGTPVNGEVRAENELDARSKIRAQNLIPMELTKKEIPSAFKKRGKVKSKDLQVFVRQMASLIGSGVPILESLQSIQETTYSLSMKRTIDGMIGSVQMGRSLAKAMSLFPNVFHKNYISIIVSGEESGTLSLTMHRLAKYIEKTEKLKRNIAQVMWYPLLVILLSIVLFICFMVFITPQFIKIFSIQSGKLPALTVFVFNCVEFLRTYWYGGILIILIPIGIIKYYRTENGRKRIDSILIHIPLIKTFIIKGSLASFARTVTILLGSGLRVMESLEIAAKTTKNFVIERALIDSSETIRKGGTVAHSLSSCRHVPEMVVNMVHIGEQTGRLDYMFEKIADFYEEEVENAVDSILIFIEPVLIVGIGGFVALMVTAMYLPLFELGGSVDYLF